MILESLITALHRFDLLMASSLFGPICSICVTIYLCHAIFGCPRFIFPTTSKMPLILRPYHYPFLKHPHNQGRSQKFQRGGGPQHKTETIEPF